MATDLNRPVSTVMAELVARVDAATSLDTLSLTTALQSGTAVSGWILGATKGSTITSNIPGIAVNSALRTYSGTPTGGAATIANGLVETLGASSNSPKSTSISVAAATVVAPVLATLTLSGTAATAGSPFSSTIGNRTTGSTLAATSSDGTTLTVSGTTVSGTFAAAGSKTVSVVETLAGATGSPKTTSFTVTVAAAAAVLATLSLDSTTATVGTGKTINIVGATTGSAITGTVPDGMTLNSGPRTITGTPTTAGTFTFNLVETLGGATGSPKSTSVTITVAAAAATGPLTTMPTPENGAIIWDMNPNTLTAVADGAKIGAYTDPTSGITAAAPGTGPTLVKNMKNGLAGFQFAAVADRLVLGKPAAITQYTSPAKTTWPDTLTTNPKPAGNGWSAIIVLHNPTSTDQYNPFFADDFNSNFFTANAGQVTGMGTTAFVGSVANDIQTVVLSGEGNTGVSGRNYVNGVLVGGGVQPWGGSGQQDMIVGAGYYAANPGFSASYKGGILRIILFKGALSAAQALQAHFWACTTYGKALPIAGKTDFWIFDGDSITYGTGSSNVIYRTSSRIAIARAWAAGTWGNVGKPSQQVYSAGTPGNDNIGAAQRDVDAFRAVLGSTININVIFGEWYNAQTAAATQQRVYASQMKTRGKVNKIFAWTSTSSQADGATRDSFNGDFMANKGVYDNVWPIHTDPNIGVDGTMRSTNTTPVTADNIHPNDLGYQYFASYIGARMTEAGYAT